MSQNRNRGTWASLALGLCLGLSLFFSSVVVSRALVRVKSGGQTIEVKGFAEKRIVSDYAVWYVTLTARGTQLTETYATLEADRAAAQSLLQSESVPIGGFDWMPVSTAPLFARDSRGMITNQIEGYRLSQQLRVQSPDIDMVTRLAARSDELVKQGIELSASTPEYFYTRLNEIKVEMLGAATEDARDRASTLATRSGSRIGKLRSARQGVFQITPPHSTEVSDYGRNDTSAREKAVKAVVTIRYSIE